MRKHLLILGVVILSTVAMGCAISDYSGFADHKTTAESKLWGTEISFSGFAPDLDGTYSYTAKYDNRGGQGVVTIYSYRNPVVSSFSRDGIVDRDGDDVQGNGGTLGGKFENQFVAVDTTGGGTCEFDANITQDKSATGPLVLLCVTTNEEIDKDFSLHANFASIDDMLGQIWSGALTGAFTMDVTALRIDGVSIPVTTLPIGATTNGVRPIQFSIENGPGVQSAIQAILDHTQDGQPVTLGLEMAGGLSVNLPSTMKVSFNHPGLASVLQ